MLKRLVIVMALLAVLVGGLLPVTQSAVQAQGAVVIYAPEASIELVTALAEGFAAQADVAFEVLVNDGNVDFASADVVFANDFERDLPIEFE
ncbi:MAG: hypothetical protein K8S97_03695 [Anaerolineae bacterium]|nr:hypothetical protein [Anaerolineae bacterium]